MPSDHIGLEEKRLQAATSFPLGEGLGWTNVQPRLMLVWLVLIYTQIVTSPEGGEGHLDRDTVNDMCVDLTCCLDTLEQDTTCPYGSVLSR